jgi:fatty-acyl-CoA synthase
MKGIDYWIHKWASTHPDRVAVITEKEKVTYKQFEQMISSAAGKLKGQLTGKKGERIAILSQNSLEYMILLFAAARVECVAVPLNIRLSARELIFQLNDSGASLLYTEESSVEFAIGLKNETFIREVKVLRSLRETAGQPGYPCPENQETTAPYIICYTSGTTGKPKGAVLTQENMFWNAVNNKIAIDLTSEDVSIVLLPLFHIGGIGLFAFPTLFCGGTIVIPGKFEPDKAISMIDEHRVTIVMGVPAIHQALVSSPSFEKADLQSVRWFYNGGAPCPQELIELFYSKGFLFGQGFGMTETSPTLFMLSKEDAPRKIGSIGKPVLFCDYKLVDASGHVCLDGEVGEILVKGPMVMKEYWNRHEATTDAIEDGWLKTGDLAKADDEGFLYIAGRKKEMIISGGENVYPLEVEQVISQLREVAEVAVVGRLDSLWGEVPEAFVVKRNGSALTGADVLEHCRNSLAKYKIPKTINFLDELPRNATGKIQKTQLIRS